jgi:hypothetical protein
MTNAEPSPSRDADDVDGNPLFTAEQRRTQRQVKELRRRSDELIARSAEATRSKEFRGRFPAAEPRPTPDARRPTP